MTIQAIETKYKGYRFRSRLEARWAVFFDALGIEWEYEKEGYELPKHYLEKNHDDYKDSPDMLYYLPDFWLPQLKIFVEVKGESLTTEEFVKAMRLSLYSGEKVLIVKNIPATHKNKLCISEKSQNEYFGLCISASATTDLIIDDWDYNDLYDTHWEHVYFIHCVKGFETMPLDWIFDHYVDVCGTPKDHFNHPNIIKAYEKARSARFEHGE